MFGGSARDARRTEVFLDGLMDAEERGAERAPRDMDLDPEVLLAARELRSGLVRVHPSFRFEEGLASRLSQTAARLSGSNSSQLAGARPAEGSAVLSPAEAEPRHRGLTVLPPRPLMVGGVGVASAAISIGAVYVAWRWSRSAKTPMVRAARAARSGRHSSGSGRRAGVLHGILG